MKRVINHKTYNVDTAREIKVWVNKYMPGDFYYVEYTLMETPKGELFFWVYGGAGTRWARQESQACWTGAEWILTPEEMEEYGINEDVLDAEYRVWDYPIRVL